MRSHLPVQYGLWIQKVRARMQPRSDGTPVCLQLRRLCTVRLYWSWSPHGWSSFAVAFDHGEKQGNKEHAWLAKSFFSGLQIVTFSLCTGHFHPSGSKPWLMVLEWSYHNTRGGFHRKWSDVHNILIRPSGFAALTSPKKLCSACHDRHQGQSRQCRKPQWKQGSIQCNEYKDHDNVVFLWKCLHFTGNFRRVGNQFASFLGGSWLLGRHRKCPGEGVFRSLDYLRLSKCSYVPGSKLHILGMGHATFIQ